MASLQYSDSFRRYRSSTVEKYFVGGQMKIFSGAKPVNCAATDPDGLLATLQLGEGWAKHAEGVVAAKGFARSFRLYAGGSKCDVQGTAGAAGDLKFDGGEFPPGETVAIKEFTILSGNF